MRSEIQNLSFTPKETDIYKIHQSGDLANLDGLDDSSLKLLPSLLTLRDAMYSSDFRDYLSTVTDSGPLSGRKTDMAINVYTPGCHLLCHDDVIGSRRVSYILYLTDPDKPWKEEWGGALRLYPTETYTEGTGEVIKVPSPDHSVSIPPAFNQLSFFAVQPGESFHDVQEVFADNEEKGQENGQEKAGERVRMAISGWYHIPQKGEDGYVEGLEEQSAEKSSLAQLQGSADKYELPKTNVELYKGSSGEIGLPTPSSQEDPALTEEDLDFLLKYIAPTYLTPDTLESVSSMFAEEFSLCLGTFLSKKFSDSVRDYIESQETQTLPSETMEIEKTTAWTVARPPYKHQFLFQNPGSSARGESPLADLLEDLFPSEAFQKWLSLATGQTITSHNLLVRRFRRGRDYTLATGYEEDAPRIELCLSITPTSGWGDDLVEPEKDTDRGSAVSDAAVKDPEIKDPAIKDPAVKDPAVKDSTVKDPAVKDATVKDPAVKDATIKDATIKDATVKDATVKDATVKDATVKDATVKDVALEDKEKVAITAEEPSVGGYLAYMAGEDEDDHDHDEGGSDHGVEVPLNMSTGARSTRAAKPKKSKQDPAIYQASGEDEDDSVLFSMPAGWNRLGIVMRDRGTMRFVKYVSQMAKGDRWDLVGEFDILDNESNEEEDEGKVDEQDLGSTTDDGPPDDDSSTEYSD